MKTSIIIPGFVVKNKQTKIKHLLRAGGFQITLFGSTTDCNFSLHFEVQDRTLGRKEDGSGGRKIGRGGAWVA